MNPEDRTQPTGTPAAGADAATALPSTGVPKTPPPGRATADPRPLETAFERLLGRQPSEQDRARLHHIRDTLGLGTSDALWLVLIALQYYYSLYERFPPLIRAAAGEVLVEFKTETDALWKALAADLEHTARDLKGPLTEAAHGA
ncbi:MAG: hypothetical protein WAV07_18960, partial [Candidatus Contendobacter sp.]